MPYLEAGQFAVHGLLAHIWTLNFVPGPYTAFELRLTITQPVVPSLFFVLVVGPAGSHSKVY